MYSFKHIKLDSVNDSNRFQATLMLCGIPYIRIKMGEFVVGDIHLKITDMFLKDASKFFKFDVKDHDEIHHKNFLFGDLNYIKNNIGYIEVTDQLCEFQSQLYDMICVYNEYVYSRIPSHNYTNKLKYNDILVLERLDNFDDESRLFENLNAAKKLESNLKITNKTKREQLRLEVESYISSMERLAKNLKNFKCASLIPELSLTINYIPYSISKQIK